ncbi:MAG: cellulase family glycosylhydrolase [Ruminococcus sp.]|nr:cellulase family glycosylhydrolase [Ruminococcus sp.]
MFKTKATSLLAAAAMVIPSLIITPCNAESHNNSMRDITTMELVRDMGIGINLGNTMEAAGDWIAEYGDGTVRSYETAWGSPEVTEEMIKGMAEEGFGVLRIPVAWSNLMGDNYTISQDYMSRVQQIVDWTIDADMYAIINIHWDNGWVNKFPDNKDENMKRYTRMWEQICDGFEDYGDHLMFESQNEELGWESIWNPWGSTDGKAESYALVNEINQKFVDVVRSSDGNNPERHLLISGYNTGIDRTCDPLFKMPADPQNRCAVSVHYYTPAGFAILEDKDESWAKARSTWGTNDDLNELKYNLDMMKTNFVDKGIPVIIGEYGCPTKGKEPDSVRLFLSTVCKAIYERNMCPVMWSTPGGHYNRTTYKMEDQQLVQQLKAIGARQPDPDKSSQQPAGVWGDANNNGTVQMNDAVLVMQAISNADVYGVNGTDKNHITEIGEELADVYDNGTSGLTNMDALLIQKYLIHTVTSLTPAGAA